MAVDRIANFILSSIDSRFNMPDLSGMRSSSGFNDRVPILLLERNYYDNKLEIPAFCFESTLSDEIEIKNRRMEPFTSINTIITNDYKINRKQINTILRDFSTVHYRAAMLKIENKDRLYYGYPGIILDSNLNTIMCMKLKIEDRGDVIAITDYICYISPSVFSNQDGIVEKTIYKKVIPFCSSYVLHNDFRYLRGLGIHILSYDWEGKHIEVRIMDDIDGLQKPKSPKLEDSDPEHIRNIILNNFDSLV